MVSSVTCDKPRRRAAARAARGARETDAEVRAALAEYRRLLGGARRRLPHAQVAQPEARVRGARGGRDQILERKKLAENAAASYQTTQEGIEVQAKTVRKVALTASTVFSASVSPPLHVDISDGGPCM